MTTQPTQLVALYPYLLVIVKNYIYVYNLTSLARIQVGLSRRADA